MSLYMEDDFALNPSGTFRAPSTVEAIRQDLGHMLDDLGSIGEPATSSNAGTIRGLVTTLLVSHPYVTSIDGITVVPATNGTNSLAVSIFINGNPSPITLTH